MADICRKDKNTIKNSVLFKIHPAIGVARVGNSPTEFFIGPELPSKGATGADGGLGSAVPLYKDGAGMIKRQAARFRIWMYKWNDAKKMFIPDAEVNKDTPGVKHITWHVHIANRKAAFFEFHGTNGERPPYSSDVTFLNKLRNDPLPAWASDRKKLVLDPGKQPITDANAGPVKLERASPGASWDASIPVDYLGELRTDNKSRLVFLGGRGFSESNPPGFDIKHYSNNKNWFDDVSDGPVTVEIEFDKCTFGEEEIAGAWVIVGPPDFGPAIENVVPLYDTVADVAFQHLSFDPKSGIFTDYEPGKNKGLARLKAMKSDGFSKSSGFATFKPSFSDEIYPILRRGFEQKWVHKYARPFHSSLTSWSTLSDPAAPASNRDGAFGFLRVPQGWTAPAAPWPAGSSGLAGMPFSMPKLLGDEDIDESGPPNARSASAHGNPKEFLSLTTLQYGLMMQWWKGNFEKGKWPASNNPAGLPPPPTNLATDVSPERLDRAALENCAGGAFFPGIEVSWLVRNPKIYGEPFRIDPWKRQADGSIVKVGGVSQRKEIEYGKPGDPGATKLPLDAGFFSEQMALPWQADFKACSLEKHEFPVGSGTKIEIGWWPAQRPDGTKLRVGGALQSDSWDRTLVGFKSMVGSPSPAPGTGWRTRGFVYKDGSGDFSEQEGPQETRIITSSPLPTGQLGVAYSGELEADGGTPLFVQDPVTHAVQKSPSGKDLYKWDIISGSLPPGLSPTTNTVSGDKDGGITGTPTTAGTYTFTVRLWDRVAAEVDKDFELVINPAGSGGKGCFIIGAAYGSSLAPEVKFLWDIRENILRQMDWGRRFFAEYWKHYYRISPAIAEEMNRDPALREALKWSIVEPWTYYMKLLLSRPDWDRVNMDQLEPPLREFLIGLRADMDKWLSGIEVPHQLSGLDPVEAVTELNVILTYVLRTGGKAYLNELVEAGELPLRYSQEQEAQLETMLRGGGRGEEEIRIILHGRRKHAD